MPAFFAEAVVSTVFIILAYLAIAAGAILLLAALFSPGLQYRIAAASSEDNTSGYFVRTLEILTDSKVNSSSSLEVLTNGSRFYPAELEAISASQHSVCLEAYIFRESKIAEQYLHVLTERGRAGVQVKVVLDALGSFKTHKHYFRGLTEAGGKIAWYNPVSWNKLSRFDNRTHRELLIVDGRTGFIGGAGIADQWHTGRDKHPRWRDTMVKVTGPAVRQLQGTFAENWLEACGEILIGPDYFPASAEELHTSHSDVLVVSSSPSSGGMTRARILFQLLIASAKKSIHITTPYFLPDKSFSDELVRAIEERGVEVKVIVPGRKSDIWLTRTSSRREYGKLLKAGASIFEYEPAMIHAKVLLIDGLWGVVGSTNCDYRSFGLNDEVNLAVRGADFVQRLEQDLVADIALSHQVGFNEWRHRSIFERLPEMVGWVFERQQ